MLPRWGAYSIWPFFLLQCFSNLDQECFTSRKLNLWWDLGRKVGLWSPYGSGMHLHPSTPSAPFISIFYTAYKAHFSLWWPGELSRLQYRKKNAFKRCVNTWQTDLTHWRIELPILRVHITHFLQLHLSCTFLPCLYNSAAAYKNVKPSRHDQTILMPEHHLIRSGRGDTLKTKHNSQVKW